MGQVIAFGEGVYAFLAEFGSPSLFLFYSCCAGILGWAAWELLRGSSESEPPSEASSGASTPPDSPRAAPQAVISAPDPLLMKHLEQQTAILKELAGSQKELGEQLRESATE
eukprot:11549853-Alexandrium_andersonii.AAC.1